MPTTIRLKDGLEDRIKKLAEQTGRPQSFYINQMIERQIDQIEWEYSILNDVEAHRAGHLITGYPNDMTVVLGLDDGVVPESHQSLQEGCRPANRPPDSSKPRRSRSTR